MGHGVANCVLATRSVDGSKATAWLLFAPFPKWLVICKRGFSGIEPMEAIQPQEEIKEDQQMRTVCVITLLLTTSVTVANTPAADGTTLTVRQIFDEFMQDQPPLEFKLDAVLQKLADSVSEEGAYLVRETEFGMDTLHMVVDRFEPEGDVERARLYQRLKRVRSRAKRRLREAIAGERHA